MNENPWNTYPFISAFVLTASASLFLLCGYYYFDGIPDSPARLVSLHLRTAGAVALWILGCALVSRTRHSTWKKGALYSLLFIPGLLILIFTTGGKTRQQLWEESNPELARRRLRHQYRPVKPLY